MQIKLPQHARNSHKGEHGKVLVVGGSAEYYGAPILAALGAEQSGADLITLYLPPQHIQAAKHYSLNFFVRPFETENLSEKDVQSIAEDASNQHVLVMGNGLGKSTDSRAALLKILQLVRIPIVIDAEGLIPEILGVVRKSKQVVLTPHAKEFSRTFGCEPNKKNLLACAKKHKITVLLKGPTDLIATSSGDFYENETGCSEMRVGGTGDVLAGIVGSFISQNLNLFDACCSAAYYWGKCGECLMQQQQWLTAHEMVTYFSCTIHFSRNLL